MGAGMYGVRQAVDGDIIHAARAKPHPPWPPTVRRTLAVCATPHPLQMHQPAPTLATDGTAPAGLVCYPTSPAPTRTHPGHRQHGAALARLVDLLVLLEELIGVRAGGKGHGVVPAGGGAAALQMYGTCTALLVRTCKQQRAGWLTGSITRHWGTHRCGAATAGRRVSLSPC